MDIEALREIIVSDPGFYLAFGGLGIGFILGVVVFFTNFCTMGSISDILSFGDYNRFRAWMLAIAIAIVGTQFLYAYEISDISRSMYLSGSLNWLGNLLGGFIFGIGMVFAGGCANRNLVRAGSGDIRSLMVLIVMALFAYMTLGGIIGPLRDNMQQMTAVSMPEGYNQGMHSLLSSLTGMSTSISTYLVAIFFTVLILFYCFSSKEFRSSPKNILAGLIIGGCIVAGWAVTGLAFDEMADNPVNPVSLSFVRPSGDTLEYLRRFTAFSGSWPGFGVMTVLGVMLGSFLAAVLSGKFKLIGFADSGDTMRNVFGAALMGIGGIVALGCTIGQAVAGFSTLAIGSLIATVAIVVGGLVGIKLFEWMLMRAS